MEKHTDDKDLISMAHIAMDAGTIEGSPASMTRKEIERAYTLAWIFAQLHNLELSERR